MNAPYETLGAYFWACAGTHEFWKETILLDEEEVSACETREELVELLRGAERSEGLINLAEACADARRLA